MIYCQNYSLKKLNSFRIDSIAKEIYFPECNNEMIEILGSSMPIIANGSNIILSDAVGSIACLRRMPKKITKISEGGYSADANVNLSEFCHRVFKDGHGGCEGLYGIPGTVGGAIYMNASSGDCISDNLISVTVFSKDFGIKKIYLNEMFFGRRMSIFQKKGWHIVSASFDFSKNRFDEQKYKNNISHRKQFPKKPNAGGIFKEWHKLIPFNKEIRELSNEKIAVLEKHINIIYNRDSAVKSDILNYVKSVRDVVGENLDVEVIFI